MRRRRCRAFTIMDAMILVGTTAVGLALSRTLLDHAPRTGSGPGRLVETVNYVLLVWTAGFLVIRLQTPRPSLRRLVCQPGMSACSAAVLVSAFDTITWAIHWALLDPRNELLQMLLPPVYWPAHSHHIGLAVVAAWLGLLLSRRWRPEPGWIDRFGRLIGALWLLTMLLNSRWSDWALSTFVSWMGLR